MERSNRSSPSSRMIGTGGNDASGRSQQHQLPPSQYAMTRPPTTMYPNGFPFAGSPMTAPPTDPQQHHLLQLQIRQQQLQLQQLQMQQKAQRKQQREQQKQRMSPPPPQRMSPPQQQRMSPPQQQQNNSQAARFSVAQLKQQQQQQQQQQQSYSASTTQAGQAQAAPPPAPQAQLPPPTKKYVPPPPPSAEQVQKWLSQCDWMDRTIYIARQLLGGSSVNGFLRATASAQRVKKQRARQFATAKKNAKKAAGDNTPVPPPTEEELKNGTMNPRTAKKIRSEMQQGIEFVKTLYGNIQGIMKEIDPSGASLPPPIELPAVPAPKQPPMNPALLSTATASSMSSTSTAAAAKSTNRKTTTTAQPAAQPTPPGNPQGSTMRRYRKRKLAMLPLEVPLSEHDATGKRIFTKKDHVFRIAQVLRFRALRAGDYVAARVSSRDLWILARVAKDYPAISAMNPTEFLSLTPAKRDALFRDKVVVRDAEEKESGEPILVPRPLVLPLPRSYGEAAEWGTRLKKGTRVYAMYPNTTSLYVSTVLDNTTYCRGDDDIIVVEFDEDDKDIDGNLPKCHIPARFTVLIPKEFPASNSGTSSKKKSSSSSSTKRTASPDPKQVAKRAKSKTSSQSSSSRTDDDAALNNMISEMAYGFDDGSMEFDLIDFSKR